MVQLTSPKELVSEGGGETECRHCGTRFHSRSEDEDAAFCCSGCAYVYRVIHHESLERFYELRGKVSRPVGSGVFSNDAYDWLEALQKESESQGDHTALELALEGVSCVGCVWLIDRLFKAYEGGISCRVNVQNGSISLEWQRGRFDLVDFARRLKQFGYRLFPARENRESESRRVVWRLGLAGAFALNGMLYALPSYLGMEADFFVARHFNWLSSLFATLSLVFCGSYFISKALRAAVQGIAHLDLPISIGVVCAYSVSWYGMWSGKEDLVYFDFVSTFLFLMLVGRWLQIVAVERNRNRLADIQLEAPQVEIESKEGSRIKASAEQLNPGDSYWLSPGQRAPVRSELLSERASLGMNWISGESESRIVDRGGEVPSGAELENRFAARLKASEEWEDSLLNRLGSREASSVERDQAAQKWIARYLLVASCVAVFGGLAWWWSAGLAEGLKVFVSVLVVSCPCALGVAWPFCDEIALARLKRSGVFVTTHTLWNRLNRVTRIVFDKTGTLTRPTLSLLNPEVIDTLDDRSLGALSRLCGNSRHPISNTIREELMAKGVYRGNAGSESVESVGLGVEVAWSGCKWRLGKSEWAGSEGGQGTVFSRDGRTVAQLQFADIPLPDSEREVDRLARSGYEVAILSGDRQAKARGVGLVLGLAEDRVHGDMLPDQKAAWIAEREPEKTLMVGDGANDTLAFRVALCSGAPANERGMVAGKADFHYLGNGIGGIGSLMRAAKLRRRAVAGLLGFAIAYNVFAVGLSLAAWVTPFVAAILMPLSSVVSLALVWGLLGRSDG